MNKNDKGFGILSLFILIILIGLIIGVGFYVFKTQEKASLKPITETPRQDEKESNEELNDENNVIVEYLSGVATNTNGSETIGIGPCETNVHKEGENVTFVFTEPFPSLKNYEEAKIIKQIETLNGNSELNMPVGKYGLYMIDDDTNQKRLYRDLKLDNHKPDILMDLQGPWYVEVKPTNNKYTFVDLIGC